MHKGLDGRFLVAGLAILLASVACSLFAPTSNEAAPATPAPVSGTTLEPASTPMPVATVDTAATGAADELMTRIKGYGEQGYLSKTDGTLHDLVDYKQELAKIDYLSDSSPTGYNEDVADFVFTADFEWGSAVASPETSGCGLYFREQANGDFSFAYLDTARVVLGGYVSSAGNTVTRFGVTKGTGRVSYANPAQAHFTLIVDGSNATVLADDRFIGSYALGSLHAPGAIGYFVKSGTNKDYGTRCEITNARLWVPTP